MEKNTKNVFRIILFIAGIAGILDTLVVSTFVNGMDLGVVLPLVIGVACIVWSLKPLYEKHLQKINPALRRITYWAFMLFLFFFIVVEGCIILGGIYIQNADVEPDYILVLGTGINADGSPSLTLEKRLLRGIEYANKYPDAYIVVSGGQGKTEPMPEAKAMAIYLVDRGISPGRIMVEDKSTSTMENFKYTKELIDPTGKIVFITNDFHVFRSTILARRNGLDAYGSGTSTPGIVLVNCYLREFFALVKSVILDHP